MERDRLYRAISPARGNAIVYSGDTHNSYAGMLPGPQGFLGAEFSSQAVSSTGQERGADMPLGLFNAAQLAANNVRRHHATSVTCHSALSTQTYSSTPGNRSLCITHASISAHMLLGASCKSGKVTCIDLCYRCGVTSATRASSTSR